MGPVHVFDYIMGMGEAGITDQFRQIEALYEQTERAQEDANLGPGADPAHQQMFLRGRLPDGFGIEAFPTRIH
jgi:hypothetical protein